MKLIPIAQKNKRKKPGIKLFAQIDDEDYSMINYFHWRVLSGKYTSYAFAFLPKSKVKITMHSLIMGARNDKIIDHIDGDGLNNQKSNLRFATYAQNNTNRRIAKNKAIKFKGVSAAVKSKTFRVRIGINKKSIYLGSFRSAEDAARAYNDAAIKYHEEFARLNVI